MPIQPIPVLLRRPWALWLALLICVFSALASTLSHALVWARTGASPMGAVCTGSRPQEAAGPHVTDSPDGQESAASLNHCPFCLPGTDRDAPPPHALAHLFIVSGEHEGPTIGQAFFFFIALALTPPPRGPPAFS